MNTEIEVKFCGVDHDEVRAKLEAAGAVCKSPMGLMRRVVIETAEIHKKGGYLRVREQNGVSTLTYKQFDALSVDGAKEIETTVADFDAMASIFRALEPTRYSYQESKREVWHVGDVEVVLDEWPWLKPYIEIEGQSEDALKSVADKLGLSWDDAVFGDVMVAYRLQYPHLTEKQTVGDLEEVKFGDPLPEMFQA